MLRISGGNTRSCLPIAADSELAAGVKVLARSHQSLIWSRQRQANLLRSTLRERRARLEGLAARLDSVSYEAVLARGYALVRDAAGQPVTRAVQVRPGQALTLEFGDGTVGARADGALPPSQAQSSGQQDVTFLTEQSG